MLFDPTERNVDPFQIPTGASYSEETRPGIGHP